MAGPEIMDMGKKAQLLASALQDHLRSISAHPEPIWGNTRLYLANWNVDSAAMDGVPNGIRDELAPRLQDWMHSDEGTWVLENVPGIEVAGLYDVMVDHVRLLVSARVDETIRVEHAMRWG